MTGILSDDTQLFKQFLDDPQFKRWLSDMVFRMTYKEAVPPSSRR
jgi:type I restriction enzyme R subunit